MHRIIALVCLALLSVVPIGIGSPIGGAWSKKVDTSVEGWSKTMMFRSGERACVIGIGDHAIGDLHLAVYDAQGTLVAEDKAGGGVAGGFTAIMWYPPRTGEYRIVARSSSGPNTSWIAIK